MLDLLLVDNQIERLEKSIAAFRANPDLRRHVPKKEQHEWIERVLLPAVIK